MPQYSDGPFRFRTWIRSILPIFLVDLGIAAKGNNCEEEGGIHEWYNKDDIHSACYHCEVIKKDQLWDIE